MEAHAFTPRDLFDGKVTYEIPTFQRPYVWTEEDQWQPLWNDIARVTELALEVPEGDLEVSGQGRRHFLGAVVLKHLVPITGDPARASVIDGQQRLTTLQILLDAAQAVTGEHGAEADAETLQELVLNASPRFKGTSKRFKLWPSRNDRVAFEQVMDDKLDVTPAAEESRIVAAHRFFTAAIVEWAEVSGDPAKVHERLAALTTTLEQRLQLVAIDLGVDDDPQLIFETLNDRGTPLLAADLIKNYVFQQCEELGVDVDRWSDDYWQDLDDDWWRDQVSQGRLFRSRIDLFLQYWLTMRLRDEIPTDAVFSRFRSYASAHLTEAKQAEQFLAELRKDADTFREFSDFDPESTKGRFYSRVVGAYELGAFIPVLLWMVSENHAVAEREAKAALDAIESWVVRRTLLRRTMKNVNKLVVALLRELDEEADGSVGEAIVSYLRVQDADAMAWPTDAEVLEELPSVRVYGNIKQPRLRVVLKAVEMKARTERSENVSLPSKLEIEHVMPQTWQTHWGSGIVHDLEASTRRNHRVNTIGNLTLVTKKLNGTLSHRPWTDEATTALGLKGTHAGMGKRSLLADYSILLLNKDIVDHHIDAWSEADIVKRGHAIASDVISIWPRG